MTTKIGSGLMSKQAPGIPHLNDGELADLRKDVATELGALAAIAVVEYTDPAAGGAALLKAATATVAAIVTLLPTDLLSGGLTTLAAEPRNLTFTTAGTTASDAPATAAITGVGPDGKTVQTETVALAQTAAAATGVKLWSKITSIVYPAADGTGATVAVGIGNAMWTKKKPKARAGLAAIVKEISAGAVVTNGTLDAVNSSYTPNTAPNGANDYAIFFEYDATA